MAHNKTTTKEKLLIFGTWLGLTSLGLITVLFLLAFSTFVLKKTPQSRSPHYEMTTKSDYSPYGGYVRE